MTALDDRREKALAEYYAGIGNVEAAIETATRVRITPEVILAMDGVSVIGGLGSTVEVLRRVFTAAGFEVED